jgi:hypothetical protein
LERRGLGSASVFSSNQYPRKPITTLQAPSVDRLHVDLGLSLGDQDSQIAVTPGTGSLELLGPATIESRRGCQSRHPSLHGVFHLRQTDEVWQHFSDGNTKVSYVDRHKKSPTIGTVKLKRAALFLTAAWILWNHTTNRSRPKKHGHPYLNPRASPIVSKGPEE